MKKLMIALVISGFFVFAFGGKKITVQRNCVTQWSYFSAKQYTNPFRDVELDMIVNTSDGKQMKVLAFWAGENEWRFRFSADKKGIYNFTTVCSDRKNKKLHQQKGVIEVVEYTGKNPLLTHGPLKISADNRHFVHADDTPFFWLADQWWHGMTKRFKWPEDFQTLTHDRKEKGFSVIGFAVGFPCDIAPFDERGQNEAGDPWMDSTFTSINPDYFELTDLRINYLVSQGLVPCLMGSWGYYLNWAGVDNMKKHYRYLIARYGAYPIVWTLAGEVTLAYYPDLKNGSWDKYKAIYREDWPKVGWYLQENDPFDRLVTVHPGPGIWDGKPPMNDMSVLDFIYLQSGHGGFHTLPRAVSQVKENMTLYPEKPVLHGEVCFEGMKGSSWEDVQRFLFWSNMMLGTAGFSYGVEGIWQFNSEEQLFGSSPNGNVWGNVPWQTAMHYSGSKHVGIGKKILEHFQWWKFEPHPEWIQCKNPDDIFSPYCAGIPGELRMVYMNKLPTSYNPYKIVNLKNNQKYRYQFIDPITGKFYPEKELITDNDGNWQVPQVPIMQEFVLVVYEN